MSATAIALLCGPTPVVAADPSLVEKGAYLARAGDCEACHTTPGGKPYAGGVAIHSPFGDMYPPNLTPDKTNGIGAWTDDQFYRALHEGIGAHGEYLYPAFPYQWFTKITRDDVLAIRAFLNTVEAVNVPAPQDHLTFPFNVRTGIAAWNALYFHAGTFAPDPKQSAEWNRGAYLVEGLGHCGDCHTPKNLAMAPDTSRPLAGGDVDNWYAPNISSDMTHGIGNWSVDDLVTFLQTGAAPGKAVVSGTMSQVVHDSLSHLTRDDVKAIAVYLKALPPQAETSTPAPTDERGPHAAGEAIYLTNCSSCHQVNGEGIPNAVPALAGNGLVRAKAPDDVIRVILEGHLATDTYSPMPAPGSHLSDKQVADVTDYVRTAWGNAAPVIDQGGLVAEIRAKTVTTISGEGAKLHGNDPCYTGEVQPVPPIDDPQHQIDQTLGAIKDETLVQSIPGLIARVRQIDPKRSPADIVNGLTLAYCRIEAGAGAFATPVGRQHLNQFSLIVYSELASNGHE